MALICPRVFRHQPERVETTPVPAKSASIENGVPSPSQKIPRDRWSAIPNTSIAQAPTILVGNSAERHDVQARSNPAEAGLSPFRSFRIWIGNSRPHVVRLCPSFGAERSRTKNRDGRAHVLCAQIFRFSVFLIQSAALAPASILAF